MTCLCTLVCRLVSYTAYNSRWIDCRNEENCPLDGNNCQKRSVIYKGVASTRENPDKVYIGLTEGTWKARHAVHNTSFKNRTYPARTTLTDYVWRMKDQNNEMPQIKWSIEKSAPAYSNINRRCILCLEEKLCIIKHPDQKNLLNKRSELVNKCPHQAKFLLKNYKGKRKRTATK